MKLFIVSVMGFGLVLSFASAGERPVVGMDAPGFTLNDADGKGHALSDYRGSHIVLYFYPRDNTPGCTKEACNLRDNFDLLKKKGIVILGVSYDGEKSHRKFRDKYNLQFPLLADIDRKVSEIYGVRGMIGAKRVTFLIGPEGKILHVFDSVKVGDHAGQILKIMETE